MARLVDLSHRIEEGMTTYPGLPGPVLSDHLSREQSRLVYDEAEFHIGRIDMVANTGTYLDTPFHVYSNGRDVAALDLEMVADLPGVCIATDGGEIGPDVLEGIDVEGRAVLFSTGWDRHWRTDRYGEPDHPYVTGPGADALIERRVALVGIDSVNIDDTRGRTRPAHSRLLGAGIPVVEHLTGLGAMEGRSFRFFAVPPPVRGIGSFPVRAFAMVE